MKKRRLALIASFMLVCSSFWSVAEAEEAAGGGDTQVEEVVVTAAAFKQLNPVKFTVITDDEIRAKGAQTAADALKDVSGLYITSNNTKGKAIAQFRGSDADNTKVFIDGVPLSPVGDGKVDLRAIPADNIAKIEIIKGAVPVIYGTDAPGGVIYITTKKADKKTAGSVTVTTGSNNQQTFFGSVGGDNGKINYNFTVKQESTDGYTAHSKESADYYNGKVSWNINPKSSLTVFGSYTDRSQQLPNRIDPATGLPILNPGKDGTLTMRNNYWAMSYNWEYDPVKNSYVGALYNYKVNDRNDLSFRVYHSNENSHLRALVWRTDSNNFQWQYQNWDGTVQGWELQDVIRTSRANTLTWGYNFETRSFTEITDEVIPYHPVNDNSVWLYAYYQGTGDYNYSGKSFYLQDITNVNRKLATSFGFRHYENSDNTSIDTIAYNADAPQHNSGTANDPVFSFNYALNGKTNLHGSVGKSYRWPNAKERSGPGGWYNGAQQNNLQPEDAVNRELGVGYTVHGFTFDTTFFKKNITNMIKGMGFGQGHTQYFNIPNVDMQGFEVEVNKKIAPHLKGFANYTYTNAYDTFLEQQVLDIPYRKFSFGLNYTGEDGVSANLALNYIGPCTSAFSNGTNSGNKGDFSVILPTQQLPGYSVIDLKVSKIRDNREYYIKISNLLDKQYNLGAYLIAPGRYVETGVHVKL